jgi:hypothetical protein
VIATLDWLVDYRRSLIAVYGLLALTAVVLSALREWRGGERLPTKTTLILFATSSVAFLILLRAPSVFYNISMNPDESQMLASAKKFSTDMNTWRSVDPNSGGPLDSLLLTWPLLLGQWPSFATARLTSCVLLAGAWLAVFTLPGRTPSSIRLAVPAGLVLLIATIDHSDYLHYSSEILPLAALAFAFALIVRMPGRQPTKVQAISTALILGAIPFAKMQAVPPALALGLALMILVTRPLKGERTNWRAGSLTAFAAAVPAVLILAPLALSGHFRDFWISSIEFSVNYIQSGIGRIAGDRLTVLRTAVLSILWPDLRVVVYMVVMAAGATAGLICYGRVLRGPWSIPLVRFAMAFLFFAASFYATIAPARPFAHYGYLLIVPVAAVGLCAWGFHNPGPAGVRTLVACTVSSAIIVLLTAVGIYVPAHPIRARITAPHTFFGAGDLLVPLEATDGSLLIWGWMPEWYVQSALIPATRDMQSYTQTWPGPRQSYYRERMLADLGESRPLYVIDAVAPGSFYYTDARAAGMASFPSLQSVVDSAYALVSRSPSSVHCPRTYVRRDALPAIERRYATISRVRSATLRAAGLASADPERLIDGVIYETCDDHWLLPDRQRGSVSFVLADPTPIESVAILNTRNGNLADRATQRVRVTAWREGAVVWTRRLNLYRFPYWTTVAAGDAVTRSDSVSIDVETFVGNGGGLNEVRIVRADGTKGRMEDR